MQIIVYVPKAYEVFKEIFVAPEKLFEMIRLDLRELAGGFLSAVLEWRLTIHWGRKRYERCWAKVDHRNGYGCCEVSEQDRSG